MIDVGPLIQQGALPHGPMILGHGPRTFAQAGCLFSTIVLAVRAMTPNKSLTVVGAHEAVLKAGAFLGSALIVPQACKALGLKLAGRGPFDIHRAEVEIQAGRPISVGVDFIPGRSSGFSDADHFVSGIDVQPGALVYADPARGKSDSFRIAGVRYRDKPAQLSEMLWFEALPH